MDSTQYITLDIEHVSAQIEDLLTGELFAIGAAGVQEDLQFEQKDRKYLPEIVATEIKTLKAYFEEPPHEAELKELLSKYPEIKISVNQHPIVDWLSQWKEQWEPFCLCENVWVVPSWHEESFDKTDKQVLYIEPGMAFGTGTHETTQIASQLLVEVIENESPQSMMDVGTGSGILALLALLKGISQLYAYDNDLESKRVFLENCEKNQASHIQWCENWSADLQSKIALTMANIIDGVLLDLKPSFQEMKSQFYIFTGILKEREASFCDEMFEDWNIEVKKRLEKGEWVGFLVEVQA